ncbi:MAG: hypothetical protein DWQ29_21430 [Planctomycetota bacterium]|nr:MAG: hypothetical protein DWQ29_21430 [Planctomycetota bacterium]
MPELQPTVGQHSGRRRHVELSLRGTVVRSAPPRRSFPVPRAKQDSGKNTMRMLMATAALLTMTASARAHFIWLVPETDDDGTTTVQVYFGEDASPDDPEYLGRIKDMNLQRVSGDDAPVPLELVHADDSLSAKLDDFRGQSLFIASHDLGVFDRGDSVFRLKYYAKSGPAVTSRAWQQTDCADDLQLDVVPSFEDGRVTVEVRFNEKPVAGAEVKASGPGLDEITAETDEEGHAAFESADAGLYSIRARHIEDEPGELNGKEYPETRHYCTVAVNVPANPSPVPFEEVAMISTPVTSFGAAIIDGDLYLYGGHTGDAHSYSLEEQSNHLTRLDLSTGEWETVAEGPHLQGLALVAHDGKLYRIGGFTAKNAKGEDHDLWSQSSVARFDPQHGEWSEMPPLPEPRSSFDAAVLGDSIYVVGGWSMEGEGEHVWHNSAWRLDLSQESPEWQALPTPEFHRRALAVAAHDGKLYAIGGMQEEGGPTRRVDVFDPESGTWSEGPELIGVDGITGFGASAFATGGRLYVSTIKGTLQRLSEDGSNWELVGKTPTARFFHRLLPLDDERLLVVGGANMGIGKFEEIEVLHVAPQEVGEE